MKESKDVFMIEEMTLEAFTTMIDLIYGQAINWSADDNIEELFAIAYVAERFEIRALMAIISH